MCDDDFAAIPKNLWKRILRAIEQRLLTNPMAYGKRLSRSLSSLWKLRVGDYRIVYEIRGQMVTVWAIRHRKKVYETAERRWLSR